MPSPDILRLIGQEQSSLRGGYENAKRAYFSAIQDQGANPSLIDQRFSPLVRACYELDGLSLENKTTSLTIFARTGMVEARRRGSPDVAGLLGRDVQRLEDNLAIARHRYDYLGVREGAADAMTSERSQTFVYMAPDGRIVERGSRDHRDLIILGSGHSPEMYTLTTTGTPVLRQIEPFTRGVGTHDIAEATAALLFH